MTTVSVRPRLLQLEPSQVICSRYVMYVMMSTSQTTQTPRIAFYNAKGGTGKTTVAINVAGALAERGASVGFIDLDPQGNATEGLGLADVYDDEPPSLFDTLLNIEEYTHNLVHHHHEFDVVPSNVDMLSIERELVIDHYEGDFATGYLDLLLSDLEDDFGWHYVIIDAPPFFGVLTDNVLYASQNVIIPSLAESTSQRAIELLLDQIELIENEHGIIVDEIAAVANRVETNNEAEKMKEWFRTAFPDVPVFEIRKRVALQRAHSSGVSIFQHDESSDMEDVFMDIAGAIVDHFDGGISDD